MSDGLCVDVCNPSNSSQRGPFLASQSREKNKRKTLKILLFLQPFKPLLQPAIFVFQNKFWSKKENIYIKLQNQATFSAQHFIVQNKNDKQIFDLHWSRDSVSPVYCAALRSTALYCTLLFCTALHCTALHWTLAPLLAPSLHHSM